MVKGSLVLIHGLMSSDDTWSEIGALVEADKALHGLRVHRFGYPSPKIGLFHRLRLRRIPDYDDVAQSFASWLRAEVPDGDIVVVAHSQGGLVVQRYLAWMLGQGRGPELDRFKLVILLACPNNGAEFLASVRESLGYNARPQTRDLTVLNDRVADTLRVVMRQVVYATGVSESRCRIPFHVYAGDSDPIVTRASAQATFPQAESLRGDHFTIIKPSAKGNFTFPVLRRHLVEALADAAAESAVLLQPGVVTGTLKLSPKRVIGRTREVERIAGSISAVPSARDVREFYVISGMPGVGKTTLATHLAQRVAAMLAAPAGQSSLTLLVRHIDLRGFGPHDPADPYDKLRHVMIDEGYAATELPQEPDELASRWRRHLTNKLPVLVLDNASNESQVEPFLPGGSGYVLLVTSRRPLLGLAGVGAVPIRLQVLRQHEAEVLIAAIILRPLNEPDREVIARIAEMCGCHPLAMTLAVAGLAAKPHLTLSDWLNRLTVDFPDSLAAVDEQLSGEDGGMAQIIGFSYRQLPEERRFVLRRISLSPVPDVSAEVAGILTGLDSRTAGRHLNRLEAESLVEDRGRWYRLHDLIRQYAAARAREDDASDNAAAIDRVLTYYFDGAAQADTVLTRQPPPPALPDPATSGGPDIDDRRAAVAWARTELSNLLACVNHVRASQEAEWTIRLATAMSGLLRNEGLWPRSVKLQTDALDAASELGNSLAQANALQERGQLHRLLANLRQAEEDLTRALTIYGEVGGQSGTRGRAHALNTLAVVVDQLGRRPEVWPMLEEALSLYRRLGDQLGEANVLNDLGMTHYFARDAPIAVGFLQQALDKYEEVNHPLGQAHAHAGLARALRRSGQDLSAARHLEAMRDLYREIGNRLGEASALVELGALRGSRADGQPVDDADAEGALRTLTEAIEVYRSIGNQLGMGSAHLELGKTYGAIGDLTQAKAHLLTSLAIFQTFDIARDEERVRQELRRLGLPESG